MSTPSVELFTEVLDLYGEAIREGDQPRVEEKRQALIDSFTILDASVRVFQQAKRQHVWVPSTLGHGEQMCALCKGTNRELAAIGELGECKG